MSDDDLTGLRAELARLLAADGVSSDDAIRRLLAATVYLARKEAADDLTDDEISGLDEASAAIAGDTSITTDGDISITTARAVTAVGRRRKAKRRTDPSPRTKALARRPSEHLAIENTVARAPVTLMTGRRSNKRVASGNVKILSAVLVKNWVRAGCRPDGLSETTFAELSRMFYSERPGGWTYTRIREVLTDFAGSFVADEWVNTKNQRTAVRYNLVQSAVITEAKTGRVAVQLSEPLQQQVLTGNWTYLAPDDLRRLRENSGRSDVPLNLFMFLESESMPLGCGHGWRVFAAPEGVKLTRQDKFSHPVAELLGLTAARRRDVVNLIRKAAAIICKTFPQYVITVESAKQATMWNLFADRVKVIEAAPAPVESLAYEHPTVGVENSPLAYEHPLPLAYRRTLPLAYERTLPEPLDTDAKCLHAGSDTTQDVGDVKSFLLNSSFKVRKDQTGKSHSLFSGFAGNDPRKLRLLDRLDVLLGDRSETLDEPAEQGVDTAVETSPPAKETRWPEEQETMHVRHVCPWYPARTVDGSRAFGDILDEHEDERSIGQYVSDAGVQTLQELGELACLTARKASAGALCAYAAVHDECPVWDALLGKSRKIRNYLARKNHPVSDPDAYLAGILRRARHNPAEMLGRTRADGEALLAYLYELAEVWPIDPTFDLPIWGEMCRTGFDESSEDI